MRNNSTNANKAWTNSTFGVVIKWLEMVYGDCLSFIPNGSSAADAAQPLESVSMKMRARVAIQHDQQHGRNKYLYTNKSLSTTYKPLSLVLKRIYIVLSLWNNLIPSFVCYFCVHSPSWPLTKSRWVVFLQEAELHLLSNIRNTCRHVADAQPHKHHQCHRMLMR